MLVVIFFRGGAGWRLSFLGGDGQDLISGGAGADNVYGGAGEDILIDIEGGDSIFGDAYWRKDT